MAAASPAEPASAVITQVASEAPPRVVVHEEGKRREIRIYNPVGLARLLGDLVLAGFYKCFMGVDRLLALEHLIYINAMAEKTVRMPVAADAQAHSRNRILLAFYLAGTMYEVGEALQELCDAKVAKNLKDRSSWMPLNELRGQWHTNDLASKVRNNLAFHLGDLDEYRKGLDPTRDGATPDHVVLMETDGTRRHSGHISEPWNVLFRGLGMTDDIVKPFADKTFHAHNSLPDLLFTFFRDVVCAHGVEVEEIMVTPTVTTAPKPIRTRKSTRDQRRREKRARRVNHR